MKHYSKEVSAIVGLDMALPECYDYMPSSAFQIEFVKAITFIGLHRIPFLDPVNERGLTEAETLQNKYLVHKVTFNNDVISENKAVNNNAKVVKKDGIPNMLHYYKSDYIAEKTKDFLNKTFSK